MKQELTDEELMTAYKLGDSSAFTFLYERHAGKVLGFLKKKAASDAIARDIFQATFLKLHRNRAKYDSNQPFLPWLFIICRSELVDSYRKEKRSLEDSYDEVPEKGGEFQSEVRQLDLSVLPEIQRKALELRYSNDLDFDEIAASLDTSSVNARKIISRALKRLRGLYE